MKSIKLVIGALVVLVASAFIVVQAVNWKVKDNYSVKFKGGKVSGVFKGLKATIVFDEAHLDKAKISATIDATTADTGNDMMSQHAKSEEALDTEKFPTITFESNSVTKTASGFEALGKLTLKGVTKDIKLPFTFANETFTGKFSIIPKEYSVKRGGTPDVLEIELTIPVTK